MSSCYLKTCVIIKKQKIFKYSVYEHLKKVIFPNINNICMCSEHSGKSQKFLQEEKDFSLRAKKKKGLYYYLMFNYCYYFLVT